jgi:hypothetical protein
MRDRTGHLDTRTSKPYLGAGSRGLVSIVTIIEADDPQTEAKNVVKGLDDQQDR